MAKTPTKVKKVKKDKSGKKKKRKADDTTTPKKKKKKVKLDSEGKAKKELKKKSKKTKGDGAGTPKKKKKKKKKDSQDGAETPKKKKKKAKTKDGDKSTGKKKGKKGKSAEKKKKGKKKKKVVKKIEEDEAVKKEAEVAPAPTEGEPAEKEKPAAPVPVPAAAAAADDGATIKLFVGNLSFDIDEDGIKEFFKDCGTITDVFWLEDKESGKFLGKGFLTFETVDQARKAFAKKDEDCQGRPIMVDYARPRENKGGKSREPRPLSERPEGCTTVFLGNLSFDIDDQQVKDFAKECGEIKGIRWLTDRDTGDFKGCGFCEFTSSDAVDKFIKLNGQSLMGRPIRIDYAQTRRSGGGGGGNRESKPMSEKPEGCTTLFLGNVSFEIDDKQIHDLAKGCDTEVKHIRWLTDRETQEFKGCGFVEFYDTASVDKFVVNNGKEVLGRSIRIDYAKPRPPRD